MKIMNNEKVASLWADKNVMLNTESSFSGLMQKHEGMLHAAAPTGATSQASEYHQSTPNL